VKWLGAEDTKQEVRGSSVVVHEAHVFCAKYRATMWLSGEASSRIKKKSNFSAYFLDFLKITSLSGFYKR
jgi:hypothetical protein